MTAPGPDAARTPAQALAEALAHALDGTLDPARLDGLPLSVDAGPLPSRLGWPRTDEHRDHLHIDYDMFPGAEPWLQR